MAQQARRMAYDEVLEDFGRSGKGSRVSQLSMLTGVKVNVWYSCPNLFTTRYHGYCSSERVFLVLPLET